MPPIEQDVRFVESDDLRSWLRSTPDLARITRGIGRRPISTSYLDEQLRLPVHLQFAVRFLADEEPSATMDRLASIPFYSLCRAVLLPLSGMHPDKTAYLFGLQTEPPPDSAARAQILSDLLEKEIGLSLIDKLACIYGDPFRGRPGGFKRDSLLRLLLSVQLAVRKRLVDRLTHVGDVAVLFAQHRPKLSEDPPLTAAEVLTALRFIPERGIKRADKFDVLRSLLARMGKLEAYFFAKLILREAGFGFDYEGSLVARVLGERFGAQPEVVAHAMALTDVFHIATVLEEEGPDGLRRIRLQPLVPVKPALASGTTDQVKSWPVWVERKYDGIRFMLHKSTDRRGGVLCGAYTRNRRDWLELVPGLQQSIRTLPCHNAIVDGELYGSVVDLEGARPATVYEVYGALQGDRQRPVQLKVAAFDVLYIDGHDLTSLPLQQRRQRLEMLLGPIASFPLAVPIQLAEGQLANDKDDVSRLYGHFRSQGYEGVITKDLAGRYLLSSRDPTWLKKKPEITLDLVLLAGVFAVTEKQRVGVFGSYAIGARGSGGAFVDVGDVAGVDRVRDAEIQAMIMRGGLITGRRIERQSASGVRPGIELRPEIVVTVRFEGIIRDTASGDLKMRDPKLVAIRSDKGVHEASSTRDIEELYLRQRVG